METFEKQVWDPLRYSKSFKFTGGEPTLNPYLHELMRIVKIYSAQTFLDTNGSAPGKVKSLIDEGLVDIVGISLKGLTAYEAAATANITNTKLCWDNVWRTIDIASKAKYVTLKINNCYFAEHNGYRRVGFDKSEIYSMVERFVDRHPEYKGRTVLFRDNEACVDDSKVVLF